MLHFCKMVLFRNVNFWQWVGNTDFSQQAASPTKQKRRTILTSIDSIIFGKSFLFFGKSAQTHIIFRCRKQMNDLLGYKAIFVLEKILGKFRKDLLRTLTDASFFLRRKKYLTFHPFLKGVMELGWYVVVQIGGRCKMS